MMKNKTLFHLKCLECGNTYDMYEEDFEKFRPEEAYTIYSHCDNCRGLKLMQKYKGFRLNKCKYCGDDMIYHHDIYYNRNGNMVQECYWMHENDCDCILDDLMMPLVIGAGDAVPSKNYVGEYGKKWNDEKI